MVAIDPVRQAVLGALSPTEAAETLRNIGASEEAAILEATLSPSSKRGDEATQSADATRSATDRWPFYDRAWQYTAHAFGYIAPDLPGQDLLPIHLASNIMPDRSLRSDRITITLDCIRVANYPGGQEHRLLFGFSGKNRLPGAASEPLYFNAVYDVQENGHVALLGQPIFTGLFIGPGGTFVTCDVIKVGNQSDIEFLDSLESYIHRNGLELTESHQPAIPILSSLLARITKSIAHRNGLIQHFDLGLDFRNTPMGARLAEGLYLAVQIPEGRRKKWRWEQWAYDRSSGRVVNVADEDPSNLIPYNYICFSLNRYD